MIHVVWWDRKPGGAIEDVTPGVDSGLNIRTRVHEYGGGALLIAGSYAYFANFKYDFKFCGSLASPHSHELLCFVHLAAFMLFCC